MNQFKTFLSLRMTINFCVLLLINVYFNSLLDLKEKIPLIVVTGPSGVGKKMDRRWIEHEYPTVFKHVPSYTTRSPRPYETKGIDYIYLTTEEYQSKLLKGELIEHACFGINCYAFSLAETKKYINLGYIPVTDVNMDGALQIKASMDNLPESDRIPLINYAVMTHYPQNLAVNIRNRGFLTEEDENARIKANEIEIKKIEKNIDSDFFKKVFYMDVDPAHPLVGKTEARMPAYRLFIQDVNKYLNIQLPEPNFPPDYKSLEPLVLVSLDKSIAETWGEKLENQFPGQFKKIPRISQFLNNSYISQKIYNEMNHNQYICSKVTDSNVEYVPWTNYVECMDSVQTCYLVLDVEETEGLLQNDPFANVLVLIPEHLKDLQNYEVNSLQSSFAELLKINQTQWDKLLIEFNNIKFDNKFYDAVKSIYADQTYIKGKNGDKVINNPNPDTTQ